MKIQIGGLSEGLHRYHLVADPAELGLTENFSHDIHVDVELEKAGTQLFLNALIHAAGRFQCDRCLTEFDTTLPTSYRICYFVEGDGDEHLDPAEVQLVAPGTGTIDLAEDVRQTILLSVPLKLLCSERCKGLCPHCGANLNTGSCTCSDTRMDTRWEKLRSLQNKNMEDLT